MNASEGIPTELAASDAPAAGEGPRGWRRPSSMEGLDAAKLPATIARAAAVLIFVVACFAAPDFATLDNIRELFTSIALVGIAATGMAVITIGGRYFMLSIGATVATGTIIFASLLHLGVIPALLITIMAGVAVGAIQGGFVGRLGTDPIITTIAASSLILGFGQLASGGLTVTSGESGSVLGRGQIFDFLPVQVLVFFAMVAVVHLVVQRTRFGRELRLLGSSAPAATVAGLRTVRATVRGYAVAGACAGVVGALLASQAGQGNLQLGASYDLDAIAAVVVGGVAVAGGRGTVVDAAVGALFIGLVGNVLLVSGFSFQAQLLFKGMIVLLAIVAAGIAGRRWVS